MIEPKMQPLIVRRTDAKQAVPLMPDALEHFAEESNREASRTARVVAALFLSLGAAGVAAVVSLIIRLTQ